MGCAPALAAQSAAEGGGATQAAQPWMNARLSAGERSDLAAKEMTQLDQQSGMSFDSAEPLRRKVR
jgi:hypothetical protein